jgi:hypothetical protein
MHVKHERNHTVGGIAHFIVGDFDGVTYLRLIYPGRHQLFQISSLLLVKSAVLLGAANVISEVCDKVRNR